MNRKTETSDEDKLLVALRLTLASWGVADRVSTAILHRIVHSDRQLLLLQRKARLRKRDLIRVLAKLRKRLDTFSREERIALQSCMFNTTDFRNYCQGMLLSQLVHAGISERRFLCTEAAVEFHRWLETLYSKESDPEHLWAAAELETALLRGRTLVSTAFDWLQCSCRVLSGIGRAYRSGARGPRAFARLSAGEQLAPLAGCAQAVAYRIKVDLGVSETRAAAVIELITNGSIPTETARKLFQQQAQEIDQAA